MALADTHPLPPSPPAPRMRGHYKGLQEDPLRYLHDSAVKYGDIVYMHVGRVPIYTVNDPALIEKILVTDNRNFRKAHLLHLAEETLGNGLLTSEGSFWLRQRRMAAPAFHRERIGEYARTMVERTDGMLAGWQDGEIRDIHQEMMHVTLEIVTRTLFGASIDRQTMDEVGRILDVALSRFNDYQTLFYHMFDWIPRPRKRRFIKAVARLDDIILQLVEQHRRRNLSAGEDHTLLGTWLAARDDEGTGMTDKQLRDEIVTLFLAGHETTANALTFALYLLSANPEKRSLLEEELENVLGNRLPAPADLHTLVYTNKVIRETLRLYPPAWRVGRENIEEYRLGEYTIPAQSQVMMCQWTVHRDPRWFENPDEFLPERWTEDFEKSIPRYAYFPFGGGPRLCIGASFAEMEAVLLLATICQRFRVEHLSTAPPELYPSITLRPVHGSSKAKLTRLRNI